MRLGFSANGMEYRNVVGKVANREEGEKYVKKCEILVCQVTATGDALPL